MDYEKKYKEALEKAQRFYNNSVAITKKGLEDIFPELKESEDEEIKEMLKVAVERTPWMQDKKEKCYEWLEKQGEHKPFAKYKVGDTIYYNSFGCLASFVIANIVEDGTDNPMYEDKDGNSVFQNDIVVQKPADKKGMNLVEEEMTPFQKEVFCIIDTTIEEEQGLKQVCDKLFALASNEIKQKPAWSEEELYKIENALFGTYAVDVATRLLNKIKSLKERYTWKPSDEQMHYLSWVANVNLGDSLVEQEVSKHLNELLEDLKKLREE